MVITKEKGKVILALVFQRLLFLWSLYRETTNTLFFMVFLLKNSGFTFFFHGEPEAWGSIGRSFCQSSFFGPAGAYRAETPGEDASGGEADAYRLLTA